MIRGKRENRATSWNDATSRSVHFHAILPIATPVPTLCSLEIHVDNVFIFEQRPRHAGVTFLLNTATYTG